MYSSAYGAPPTTTSFIPRVTVAGMRAHASTSTSGLFSGSRRPDEQEVLAGLRPEALERRTCAGLGVRRLLDAVGHDADALAVALLEDLRDRVGVGESGVRPARRVALGEAQVGLGDPGPLGAVGVQPSTLMTVGMPAARVIRHMGELPAMKNSATSGLTVRAAWIALRNVWVNVSRYLLRTVGRWTSRAPFHWVSRRSTTCGRQ
jgi:hypothetical protein